MPYIMIFLIIVLIIIFVITFCLRVYKFPHVPIGLTVSAENKNAMHIITLTLRQDNNSKNINGACDAVPEMITVAELQETLAIGRDTAYNLVRRKDFPSIKLGKEYRIFVEQLPDWLRRQQKNK